jgi:mutator protein MutT
VPDVGGICGRILINRPIVELTSPMAAESKTVLVAVGLIWHQGCLLVGVRAEGSPLAGFHEFPGGKCWPGETPNQAVVRECREETGLDIEVIKLRSTASHDYPHGRVEITFFDCQPRSIVTLKPGFQWVTPSDLSKLNFPEANQPLLAELAHET